ncbi:MAG: LCP family protein [Eubacteriales bacterium]
MKHKRWLTLPLLLLAIFLLIFAGCGCLSAETPPQAEKKLHNFLIAGYDEAACNTDVLALVSYDAAAHTVSVMQIPRDTYLSSAPYPHKINAVFAAACAAREDSLQGKREAMSLLQRTICETFGVPIDHYIAVSLQDFVQMIDRMGGVEVTLPFDMSYWDEARQRTVALKAGKQTLNGRMAEQFVRFRRGYAEGDLGRIDAQKLLIAALLDKAGEMNISVMGVVFTEMREHMVTDVGASEALTYLAHFLKDYRHTKLTFMNLPGEAVTERQISYYAANRAASAELLGRYFSPRPDTYRAADFDPRRALVRPGSVSMRQVYERQQMPYHIFTKEELQDMHIKTKG